MDINLHRLDNMDTNYTKNELLFRVKKAKAAYQQPLETLVAELQMYEREIKELKSFKSMGTIKSKTQAKYNEIMHEINQWQDGHKDTEWFRLCQIIKKAGRSVGFTDDEIEKLSECDKNI